MFEDALKKKIRIFDERVTILVAFFFFHLSFIDCHIHFWIIEAFALQWLKRHFNV